MVRVAPAQRSTSAGEISELLHGRPDFARYQQGVDRCRGFLPIAEGAALRLPGTRFVGRTYNDQFARLTPAVLFDTDSYILEWTDRLLRFWRQGSLLRDPVDPVGVVTVYTAEDLESIQWLTSADRVYLCDGRNHPQRLTRSALSVWSIEDTPFLRTPFLVQNLEEAHTISASAATGTVTLTASEATFDAGHVGAHWMLTEVDRDDVPEWEPGTVMATGDKVRSEGSTYELVGFGGAVSSPADIGTVRPVHQLGDVLSGKDRAIWRFVHDGNGYVVITAVASPTSATATVSGTLPDGVLGTGTYRWREGAWSVARGYPKAMWQVDDRHVYAGTRSNPLGIDFGANGAFLDFTPSLLADGAFSIIIRPPRNVVSQIVWGMTGGRLMHVSTRAGGAWARATDEQVGFSIDTFRFFPGQSRGSADIQAIEVDGSPIYASRNGKQLGGESYRLESDDTETDQINIAARHVFKKGIRWMQWQEYPLRVLWCGLLDGSLVSLTYEPEEGVYGFARHDLGGHVESGCVKPTDDESSEELWLVVRRTIGGVDQRHIEIMAEPFGLDDSSDDPPDLTEAWHLFGAIRYQGAARRTITGLGHLEGQEVYAWTEHGAQGPYTVADEAITLQTASASAIVGIDRSAQQVIRYLDQAPSAADGGSDGRLRKARSIGLRVRLTSGGTVRTVRQTEDGAERLDPAERLLKAGDVPFSGPRLFSGIVKINPAGGYGFEKKYDVMPEPGAPLTVQGITPIMNVTND